MITNYFFLSAGIVGLFFAVGHAVFIQKNIMSEVDGTGMQKSTKQSIFGLLHYGTSMVFLSGVALIIASTFSNPSASSPLAWFISSINAGNLLVAIFAILTKEKEALLKTMPQLFVMVVWIGIVIAGIIV